jgi:hypothetical protein
VNDYFTDLDNDPLTWKINNSTEGTFTTISFSDAFTGWNSISTNSYTTKYTTKFYANDGTDDSVQFVNVEVSVEDPLEIPSLQGLNGNTTIFDEDMSDVSVNTNKPATFVILDNSDLILNNDDTVAFKSSVQNREKTNEFKVTASTDNEEKEGEFTLVTIQKVTKNTSIDTTIYETTTFDYDEFFSTDLITITNTDDSAISFDNDAKTITFDVSNMNEGTNSLTIDLKQKNDFNSEELDTTIGFDLFYEIKLAITVNDYTSFDIAETQHIMPVFTTNKNVKSFELIPDLRLSSNKIGKTIIDDKNIQVDIVVGNMTVGSTTSRIVAKTDTERVTIDFVVNVENSNFSQVKGDLTNSSLFDGGDVAFLASYVAGNNNEITEYANKDPYFVEKADFTGDGGVSGADVVRMASVIAGLATL